MFVLFFFLILNLVLSYWNASVVGRYWTEKGKLPTWIRISLWSGAIMAVCGFFVVYVSVLTMLMHDLNLFPFFAALMHVEISSNDVEIITQSIFNLATIIVYIPAVGTGFVIWINSLAVAYIRRDFTSTGVAVYNTWAQVRNTVNAVRYVPRASAELGRSLGKLFKGKKSVILLVYLALIFLPVVISLGGAIATTAAIIKASDEKFQLEDMASS